MIFFTLRLHELANQQYCISFQLSHNLFTAARRQDPPGNIPNLCNATSYYIFHLATADRCDKIASSQATPPKGWTEAIPTAAPKKDCKLFHTQVKLFQVNLHLKFFLQRHLYFSMYHWAVLGWFYFGSKQHLKLEIIQHWRGSTKIKEFADFRNGNVKREQCHLWKLKGLIILNRYLKNQIRFWVI